jgi:hypothetical protein
MKRLVFSVFVLGLAFASVSCTSGRTMVLNTPPEQIKAAALNVVKEKSTVSVPQDVDTMFRDKLEAMLFVKDNDNPSPFTKGNDITIHYRFIQFTAGSQFKRWLAGGIGGYGEGVMTVEAIFVTSTGKEISKIQSEGKIGAGLFGGAIDSAVDKCVEEIVQYTKQNFH